METISRRAWLQRVAASLGLLLCMAPATRAQSPTLSIVLTGQSLLRSGLPAAAPTITSLLTGDAVFTNFEATVFDPRKGQSRTDGAAVSPEALESLKTFGFNLLSLSNNHSWDFKVLGIENTLEQAKRLGLVHAGIGHTIEEAAAPGYMHTPKGTVALVAMASGLIADGASATGARPGVNELRIEGNAPNPNDAQRILQSIRNAKQRADLVVVYQHNHVFDGPFGKMMRERLPERLVPPDWLVKWTHAEVDAGADIIVMHGAPLLHGVEIYRDRPIFFDLGNFIFQTALANIWEPTVWESVVAYVDFEGTALKSIKFRPIAVNKIDQSQADSRETRTNTLLWQTSNLPRVATGEQAYTILQRLADLSRPFGTIVEIDGEMAAVKLKAGN
jgi:poly-gamma-glutamate capsule biosynthesis protein CapA/YwtB (metallophosphatase superfamily)